MQEKSEFNYEKSLWGERNATLKWSDPAAFRLKISLLATKNVKNILEVGCGAGQFIRALKFLNSKIECYGCDISKSAIDKARALNDGVNYTLSTNNVLPYEDEKFDSVFIYDVLEHVEEPLKIISEVKRVLKTGGVFYMFVPCEGDVLSFWYWLVKIGWGKGLTKKYAGHINHFTRAQIYSILKQSEFTILKKRYSEHFFGQILGVLSFYLMDKYARKNNLNQINNESYFASYKRIGFFKKIVNILIYLESAFLCLIPSPNLHIIVKK